MLPAGGSGSSRSNSVSFMASSPRELRTVDVHLWLVVWSCARHVSYDGSQRLADIVTILQTFLKGKEDLATVRYSAGARRYQMWMDICILRLYSAVYTLSNQPGVLHLPFWGGLRFQVDTGQTGRVVEDPMAHTATLDLTGSCSQCNVSLRGGIYPERSRQSGRLSGPKRNRSPLPQPLSCDQVCEYLIVRVSPKAPIIPQSRWPKTLIFQKRCRISRGIPSLRPMSVWVPLPLRWPIA